jgi:hypothetical protein
MKAVARIESGILFEWVTHRKPTLSDLYLIHQQGWEGAAEHISQPDRIAWKSMCATGEGKEKGEKWSKRAIWRNTLPAVKDAWKSVDKLTSGRSSECGASGLRISIHGHRSRRTDEPENFVDCWQELPHPRAERGLTAAANTWCRASLSGPADALYVVNDALGSCCALD